MLLLVDVVDVELALRCFRLLAAPDTSIESNYACTQYQPSFTRVRVCACVCCIDTGKSARLGTESAALACAMILLVVREPSSRNIQDILSTHSLFYWLLSMTMNGRGMWMRWDGSKQSAMLVGSAADEADEAEAQKENDLRIPRSHPKKGRSSTLSTALRRALFLAGDPWHVVMNYRRGAPMD